MCCAYVYPSLWVGVGRRVLRVKGKSVGVCPSLSVGVGRRVLRVGGGLCSLPFEGFEGVKGGASGFSVICCA